MEWSMREWSKLKMMCAWTNAEVLEIWIFIDSYWEKRERLTLARMHRSIDELLRALVGEKRKMKICNIKWNFLFLKCKEISLTREWASSSSACYANLLIFFLYIFSHSLSCSARCVYKWKFILNFEALQSLRKGNEREFFSSCVFFLISTRCRVSVEKYFNGRRIWRFRANVAAVEQRMNAAK